MLHCPIELVDVMPHSRLLLRHGPLHYDSLNGTDYSQQPVVERDSGTPYWLETIRRQGRSAFGPLVYCAYIPGCTSLMA